MYKQSVLLLLALFFAVSASHLSAQEIQIKDILWKGSAFIVQFSDSLNYEVDLVETDSSNLVIRLSSPLSTEERALENGSKSLKATLSRSTGGGMQILTIQGKERFGYSTLWLPYSHRLIVHTFPNWDKLSFAEGEYHRGLNALELNTPDVAERSLSQVIATDKGELARQASSVLGILYAREGKDSLARTYLKSPVGPDDYMALAEIARRAGDSVEAAKNEQLFAENLQRHPESTPSKVEPDPDDTELQPAQSDSRQMGELLKSWKGLLLIGLVALVVIGLAIWFARKPEESTTQLPEEAKSPTPTVPEEKPKEESSTSATSGGRSAHFPFARAEQATPSKQDDVSKELEDRSKSARHSAITPPEIPLAPEPETPVESAPPLSTSSAELPRPDAAVPATPDKPAEEISNRARIYPESRTSSQAEQLREKMAATSAGATAEQPRGGNVRAESSDDDTTISEARKLNVSRDYVELRNRIADLRQKIEEKK